MKKGLTLLEVIISMFLLSLVAEGIFATFAVVGKQAGTSDNSELQAINYARQTLETLRNAVSEDPAHSADLGADAGVNPHSVTTPSPFTRSYTVEDVDINADTVPDYKKVTVTVTWPD